MKLLKIMVLICVITLGVSISGIAGVVFFNSDSSRIGWEDHKSVVMNWKQVVSSRVMDQVNGFLNGADVGSLDTDAIVLEHPEVVRQVRLEQWRRFRESGAK